MATYIANKPCHFGGKAYFIGEKIPGEKILPRRIGGLLRMGVITESADEPVKPSPAPTSVESPKKQSKVKEDAPKAPEK